MAFFTRLVPKKENGQRKHEPLEKQCSWSAQKVYSVSRRSGEPNLSNLIFALRNLITKSIKNAVAQHGLCSNFQKSLSVYSAQDKDVSHRCFSFCVLSPRPAWRCILGETFFCACQAYILWLPHTPVPPWPASEKAETLAPVHSKAHRRSANH